MTPPTPCLITGAAGFIGFHLSRRLLENGLNVIGFDNMNDYYDVSLKEARLSLLEAYDNFTFIKGDLADKAAVFELFSTHRPSVVVNLAAQAGVRHSIENPDTYINANLIGFFHILEACRRHPVRHLLFASSSSVYGSNEKTPFSTADMTDSPISLYAATKKSNELLAYSYSHLYDIAATGLRFFTVYGPYGRPDMACFKFCDKIMRGEAIQIYNNGDMYRDFTYIDDIVGGIERMILAPPQENGRGARYKVYNIGNNKPEHLLHFIAVLEGYLGQEALKEYLPIQPGDVPRTCADVDDLIADFDFRPATSIEEGLARFVAWYKEFYS